jgi:predicted amidohydrolase
MIVDPSGNILQMAERGEEALLVQEIDGVEEDFGTKGIRTNNERILGFSR